MYNQLVSILIPVFNSDKFIAQTLNSAITQTYKNIEIIVADNQSTDNTWRILQTYQKKDDRIKLFRNSENIGPVKNWKRCIDNASGKYAKFLWSDDYIANNFIEETLPYLENNNVGFVFTKTEMFNENTKKSRDLFCLGESGIFNINKFIYGLLIDGDYPVSPGCGLFRKSDLKNNLIIYIPNKIDSDSSQHAIGNDALIYLLTAKDYPKFAYVNKKLSYFRAHKNSITTSSTSHKLENLYNIAKAYYVENYVTDKKLIKRFNSKLFIMLNKHKNNYRGLKKISDFYLKNKIYTKDNFYILKKILIKYKKSISNEKGHVTKYI